VIEPHDAPIGRRGMLSLAVAALSSSAIPRPAAAAPTGNDPAAIALIQHLDDALLAVMKAGHSAPFEQRVAALAPVIEQTFDLDAVLAASIGPSWNALPDDQKTSLRAAFRRYTVASYAANFDSYTGQTFQIAPAVRNIGDAGLIVQTRIVPTDGPTTQLDYVMRNGPAGWKVVDVLADGSISRVAVQRSDFRHLLTGGGVAALMAGLQHKIASHSGGMPA
jgi:phospholipid transport system substrate-binding protein